MRLLRSRGGLGGLRLCDEDRLGDLVVVVLRVCC